MVLKFTIHWLVLKQERSQWAQTKNLQDKQDSKLAYSINGSAYFNKTNKTNVDGKHYFCPGVACCIDDCSIVLLYILQEGLFW